MSIEIKLNHIPAINFSMQQNHVPVIRYVTVKNNGHEDLDDLDILITFDPECAAPVTLHIDRLKGEKSLRLEDIPVKLSTSFLSNLTERIAGLIKAEVRQAGLLLAEATYDISILAFDQWCGLSVHPPMLAAFVTPNHPEITPIIRRASEILKKWTGDPALDDYQRRDPNRVKQQMAAVYEAIAELKITYCSAPASFEETGQRIRLYSDILSGRLATCLDITLLYAGCLEAIGLHPIIAVMQGHAFAGAWLIQETFPDAFDDDVSLLTKRIADGINEILMVETTCMTTSKDLSFDEAVANANAKLADSDKFLLSLDIKRARNALIRPLPQRVFRDGAFEIEEAKPEKRDVEAPDEIAATVRMQSVQKLNIGKQTIWERKLLDLSLRNNLINTRMSKNTLQVITSDVVRLEKCISRGEEFQMMPKPTDWDNDLMSPGLYHALNASDPLTALTKEEMSHHRLYSYFEQPFLDIAVRHLSRSARTSMEENGTNTLFMAIGLLKWFETPSSTRPRFAPIILIPVEIIQKTSSKAFIIRSRGEEPVLNVTLMEMLRQNFGISMTGLDPLPTTDGHSVDVKQVFNAFRRLIMSEPGWDIEEQAVIGNFSFSKFIMWNDLRNNTEQLERNKIVASLISGKKEWSDDTFTESDIDLDETHPVGSVALPIGADSSQLEAICASVAGRSFILHGPPGTGKSQTITNIIANALYAGKKVLFVAEKMAALQVVQRRLEAIGIAPFCLELHSNKTKKSYIIEQLKRASELARTASSGEYALKASQLGSLRKELNTYVKALHKTFPAGLSLYDCLARYSSIGFDGRYPSLSREVLEKMTPEDLASADTIVEAYRTAAAICGDPATHPLRGIDLTSFRHNIRTEAAALLEETIALAGNLLSSLTLLSAAFGYPLSSLTIRQLDTLDVILDLMLTSPHIAGGLLKEAGSKRVYTEIERILSTALERNSARSSLLKDLSEPVLNWDYTPWKHQWEESKTKWWLPRTIGAYKVKKSLRPYSRGKKNFTPEDIDGIFGQLDIYTPAHAEMMNADGRFASLFGEIWHPDRTEPETIQAATAATSEINRLIHVMAKNAPEAAAFKSRLQSIIDEGLDDFRELRGEDIRRYLATRRHLETKLSAISSLLVADIPADTATAEDLEALLRRWNANLDQLRDWSVYRTQRALLIDAGLNQIPEFVEAGEVKPEWIVECYGKSLYSSYAEFILSHEPELNTFHGTLFEKKIERFREMSAEFEALTCKELFATLASRLPDLEKDTSLSEEAATLQRNLRNGARGTSIRKLFDQIPDLLTRLCPCMLMSPISVAQYIAADRTPFDLVIFDEASQMPTSEAIGAIARGSNLIVVGDPKQMPPTNFFAANNFDEDHADKEDMENILEDCMALSMPSKHLLWHYRSRHESLIAFSNSKYYNNRLLTFPSPDDLRTKVSLQYVEGVYDRGSTRQNRGEAEAVVEEIGKRLSDPATSKMSIGVVTFNSNQQSLIEDLLNKFFSENPELEAKAMAMEERIFVKNLENVQGDERDVILFSIGYGMDSTGKVALNFGPLNRDGGSRRLNVAVSRARYEMKVFSSLRPEQIDLNRTSAEGVADLKDFLEYAEKGRETLKTAARSKADSGDMLAEAIAERLTRLGYSVRTNIGTSGYRIDIGVVNPADPETYLIGLMLDGQRFASEKTAGDRLITQEAVLRHLGWRIHRIWAMDWWENPEKTLKQAVEAIEKARRQADSQS